MTRARRVLQVTLGVVWLLDAALQFQPFMFGRGFALEVLKPTAQGNPSIIARPILWSAQVVLAHPQFWNTIFALTQLAIALAFFWRRTVKLALIGTVVWSLIVWWLGEGLGGVFAGSAAPLMGAPGAVILYALLALLLWPRADEEGRSLAETSVVWRIAPVAWVLVWAGEAYFALLPANDSASSLHGMLAGMTGGEPHAIAALDRWLARFVAHSNVVGPLVGALLALCALAVLLPPRWAKPLYVLSMVMAMVIWVGQDFGGVLTGQGTDPNSGPLLFLLALAYWPLRAQRAESRAAAAYPRPLFAREGVAVAAAVLVAATSVAAATGITSPKASASGKRPQLSVTSRRMLGPGPVSSNYSIAGYEIHFSDRSNRARHPGDVSIDVRHHSRPVSNARITITYRSLDMAMPSHTLHLAWLRQGQYGHPGPVLTMGGRWQISISVSPRHIPALLIRLTDLIGL